MRTLLKNIKCDECIKHIRGSSSNLATCFFKYQFNPECAVEYYDRCYGHTPYNPTKSDMERNYQTIDAEEYLVWSVTSS